MEYYSAIKRISPFAALWMDLENIMLSEMSDRERQILYDITYMWNLKNNANNANVYIKQKQTHRHRKQPYGYQKEEGVGEGRGTKKEKKLTLFNE